MTRRVAFSLAETTLSIFLLAVVVLLLFNLYPTSSLTLQRGRQQLLADTLAQSLVDEKLSVPFSQLVEGKETLPPRNLDGTRYQAVREVFVPDQPGVQARLLKGVRVTVSWELKGVPREVVHESWVACVRR